MATVERESNEQRMIWNTCYYVTNSTYQLEKHLTCRLTVQWCAYLFDWIGVCTLYTVYIVTRYMICKWKNCRKIGFVSDRKEYLPGSCYIVTNVQSLLSHYNRQYTCAYGWADLSFCQCQCQCMSSIHIVKIVDAQTMHLVNCNVRVQCSVLCLHDCLRIMLIWNEDAITLKP